LYNMDHVQRFRAKNITQKLKFPIQQFGRQA